MSKIITALLLLLVCGLLRAQDLPPHPLQTFIVGTKDLFPQPIERATNRPTWKSSVTFGLAMARGNQDNLLLNGKIQTKKSSGANEYTAGLDGAYGEDNSVKNYELLHGFAQMDHSFTHRFFEFTRFDGLHDGIKDIDYRFTVSPGLGYYMLRQTNMSLALEGGPSVVSERQGNTDSVYAALRTAERFEFKLNGAAKFWEGVEYIPQLDRMDNFIVNVEVGVESSLTKTLALQISLQDNFANDPAPGFQNNDLRLVSGLTYKF